MDKKQTVLIAIALIIVLGSLVYTISNTEKTLQEKTFYSEITVSKNLAFNVENSTLHFGKISPNGSIKKTVNVTNSYKHDIYAKTTSKGNITPFLNYENTTRISTGSKKPLHIIAKTPNKTKYKQPNKTYTGNVTISLFRR